MDKKLILKMALITIVIMAAVSYAAKNSDKIQAWTASDAGSGTWGDLWDWIKAIMVNPVPAPSSNLP
jgi:ABC-type cobalt transport system substrate-binding protein